MQVKDQFGSVEKKIKDLEKANIALYTVWAGETLDESEEIVDKWLKGKSTYFVIQDEIGVASKADFRKAMIDLNTMKVISVDPADDDVKSVDSMIKACEKLDGNL